MRLVSLIVIAFVAAAHAGAAETLEEAWRAALSSNHSMRAARLRSEAARHGESAATAQRWPTASARTGYTARSSQPSFVGSQPGLGITSFVLPFAQRNTANFSARAEVPLWTGGRIENSIAASRSRRQASVEQAEWEKMLLWLAVGEAYLGVLQAQESLAAAESLLGSAEAHSEDVKRSFQQQRTPRRDVLAAQVAALEARQQLIASRHGLTTAIAAYNQLLGRPRDALVALVEPAPARLERSLEELTQFAIANRPDIRQLRHAADSHAREAAVWRASRRPQVSAEVGFNFEENRFQSPQGLGAAGVVVDWKFFDAGERRQRSFEADSNAAALRAELQEQEMVVSIEVLQAWNHREQADELERVAAAALDHAVEMDRFVQGQHLQGLAVNAEAIASRAAVIRAKTRLANDRMNRIFAQLRLRFASGLAWVE